MSRNPPDPATMPAGRPDAEVHIDEALIRRLLTDQHPDLATLQPTPLDSGWDNEIYRLGDAFTVRMPRRQIAANLLVNEQTWLPELAPRLPIAVPSPVRTGTATDYYPWRWSVLPWFEGESADLAPPATADAERFADFLLALHHEAPANAPYNPVRGVPLRVRENNTQERLIRVREKTDLITAALEEIWGKALAAPGNDRPRWLHGDLHAQNVLVDGNGTISAVIDWGDITAGDVATDLAGIWALFETPTARARCLAAYAPDSDLLARARGWAFSFGVILVDSGLINSPRHATAGTRILTRLAADAG